MFLINVLKKQVYGTQDFLRGKIIILEQRQMEVNSRIKSNQLMMESGLEINNFTNRKPELQSILQPKSFHSFSKNLKTKKFFVSITGTISSIILQVRVVFRFASVQSKPWIESKNTSLIDIYLIKCSLNIILYLYFFIIKRVTQVGK